MVNFLTFHRLYKKLKILLQSIQNYMRTFCAFCQVIFDIECNTYHFWEKLKSRQKSSTGMKNLKFELK